MNIQGWFPLGLTGLISLQSKGLSRVLQHHSSEAPILHCSAFFVVQLTSIHDYWKNHSFDYADLCWQSDISYFFHMLSRFVIAYLPRSKHLLIWRLQSPSAVILETKKIKSITVSSFSASVFRHEVMGWDAMIVFFFFLMLNFKPALSIFSFALIKWLCSSSSLSATWWFSLTVPHCQAFPVFPDALLL